MFFVLVTMIRYGWYMARDLTYYYCKETWLLSLLWKYFQASYHFSFLHQSLSKVLLLHLFWHIHSPLTENSKELFHINSCFCTCQTSTINHITMYILFLQVNLIIILIIFWPEANEFHFQHFTVFLLRLLYNQISNHTHIQV